MRQFRYVILAAVSLALTACADPLKESFDQANLLIQQKEYRKAHDRLKDLCVRDAEKYCDSFNSLKRQMYDEDLRKLSARFVARRAESTPMPLAIIDEMLADARLLEAYGIQAPEYDSLLQSLKNEKIEANGRISEAFKSAENLFAEGKYREAIDALGPARNIHPDMIDKKVVAYRKQSLESLYPQIQEMVKTGNWRAVHPLLDLAVAIMPEYRDVRDLLEQAKVKDTAEYNVKQAEEFKKARKFDAALAAYEKAMEYPESKDRVLALYHQTKLDLVEFYFSIARDRVDNELYRDAFDNFKKGFQIMETLPKAVQKSVAQPKKDIQKFADNLYLRAKKAEDQESFGLAYACYRLIAQLAPVYPEIKENTRKIEEKIAGRAMKSLAVIAFESKSKPEAGSTITSNIMQALYNDLRNDIKIIERESMDVLLREYELNVAGKGSEKSKDSTAFQISSADFLLLGKVLDHRVDSTREDIENMMRVKVRTEQAPNPDFEIWKQAASKARADGLPEPPSPPPVLEKPVFENITRKMTNYKKVAVINVSYRIVDAAKQKILAMKSVESRKDVSAEQAGGVELGEYKVAAKVANLPTDTELIKHAEEDVTSKILAEIKLLFKDPEDRYLADAETFEKEGNLRDSVERFADALILMKRKGKTHDGIEMKVVRHLDSI